MIIIIINNIIFYILFCFVLLFSYYYYSLFCFIIVVVIIIIIIIIINWYDVVLLLRKVPPPVVISFVANTTFLDIEVWFVLGTRVALAVHRTHVLSVEDSHPRLTDHLKLPRVCLRRGKTMTDKYEAKRHFGKLFFKSI